LRRMRIPETTLAMHLRSLRVVITFNISGRLAQGDDETRSHRTPVCVPRSLPGPRMTWAKLRLGFIRVVSLMNQVLIDCAVNEHDYQKAVLESRNEIKSRVESRNE
jgi:hypothetical protein